MNVFLMVESRLERDKRTETMNLSSCPADWPVIYGVASGATDVKSGAYVKKGF